MKINMKNFLLANLSIFLLVSFISNVAYADNIVYNKQIRGKVMDNFKDEQYNNIFEKSNILLWNQNVNFFDTLNQNQEFETKKSQIQDTKNTIIEQKESITTRKLNLEETIKKLDEEIQAANDQIITLNREILKLSSDVEWLKVEVDSIQKQITESKKVLLEYIAHIYKKSNIGFEWWEIDSIKTILLNSWNLSDFINDIHFSSIIEVTGQTLIEKHRKLIRQLFVKKLDYESKIEELKEYRRQETVNRKSILEKKDFREKILQYTNWKESMFEEFIKEKEKEEKQVQLRILQNKIVIKNQKQQLLSKYNCDYIDLDNLSVQDFYMMENIWSTDSDYSCVELNKILQAESQLKSFSWEVANVFSWPVAPLNWLSAYFKDPDYEDVVWTSHDAIDIRTPQWTDIVAPADGYITYLRAPTDQNYAYVVLKHADWYITVYGHISEVLYWKYDFIKAWQVFAKSWWELWTNWAWYMTTWPHLHFEVYKDKSYIDPLDVLDLTVLWEDKLPNNQKYVYKFLDDYKVRNGSDYEWDLTTEIKMFTLNWETEVDRQKDLLNNYAVWDFKNWDMWVEEWISWNIDPSFLMCVWLAESWLWRNLKTPYNVWNVWNTDSWWTWELPNARSWVYRMVRTLNNKFLWEYDSMNKLSRYWNKTWAIYASSPLHWHTNITKCLTALKQKSIPDDYKFRIGN